MIDAFLSNPNAVFGAVLLACFGAWLAYRTAHRGRRANACATFRSAVITELGSIYPNPVAWPDNVDVFLRAHFTALQSAVENFRPFVPWWNRWRFDCVWFRYRCATGRKVDIQCYHCYMAFGDNPNYKAIFHANVSSLLSFANET
jgi:hypothetical protein